MEYFCQDNVFHMAISITQRQHLHIKNTVWKNWINSITNQDIDLKFLRGMTCCMAHIFVTVNFSKKCLFMGATFRFWIQVRSEPSRCGQHKDPGQALTQAPLEVQRGYVAHITSQICMLLLLNWIWLVSWIFIGLEKYFIYKEARFWVAHCIHLANFG